MHSKNNIFVIAAHATLKMEILSLDLWVNKFIVCEKLGSSLIIHVTHVIHVIHVIQVCIRLF